MAKETNTKKTKDNELGFIGKLKRKQKKSAEDGARKKVLEDLFYDFNRSRAQIYKLNFFRGIFVGAGTVIGGTVVIGLLIWFLTFLGNFIPPLGDFFEGITSSLEQPIE